MEELKEWDIIWVLSKRFIEWDDIFRAKIDRVWYHDAMFEDDYDGVVYNVTVNCSEYCRYRMNENLEYMCCDSRYEEQQDTELFHKHDKGFINKDEAIKFMKEHLKEKVNTQIRLSEAELKQWKDYDKNMEDMIDKKVKAAEEKIKYDMGM